MWPLDTRVANIAVMHNGEDIRQRVWLLTKHIGKKAIRSTSDVRFRSPVDICAAKTHVRRPETRAITPLANKKNPTTIE